jgi:hypothetical protein
MSIAYSEQVICAFEILISIHSVYNFSGYGTITNLIPLLPSILKNEHVCLSIDIIQSTKVQEVYEVGYFTHSFKPSFSND